MALVTIIFLVGVLEECACSLQHLSPSPPAWEVLKQYPQHDFIFHYDNGTFKDLDVFFQHPGPTHPAFQLINYDSSSDAKRPVGYKFIHVVFLRNPFLFETFSDVDFNLEYTDVVVFVMYNFQPASKRVASDYHFVDVWSQRGLEKSSNVIVYDLKSRGFYYVQFYVGVMAGVLRAVEGNGGGSPNVSRYMNEFLDFKGHVFQVAFYPYDPFISCTEVNNRCHVKGIDGKLLDILSQKLNFKFVMIKSSLRAGGEWKAMIEDVHYKRKDWAVGGISTSRERMLLADFTTMIHMESYRAFYVHSDEDVDKWKSVLQPFQLLAWMCLFVIVCFIAAIMKLATSFRKGSKRRKFARYVHVLLHTISEQSIPNLKIRTLSLKLILSTWFMISIIITTSYKSKLASSMIKPITSEPQSVIDLYEDGYWFQTNTEDWTVLRENLENSNDRRYKMLTERSMDDLQVCPALLHAFDGKIAVLDEETLTQYALFTQCKEHISLQDSLRLRIVKQEIFPSIHAWPLQLGAPYRSRFSLMFQRLIASGLIEYWYKTATVHNILKIGTRGLGSSTSSSLTLTTFLGPAFILFIGQSLASMAFMWEIVYHKYTEKRRR